MMPLNMKNKNLLSFSIFLFVLLLMPLSPLAMISSAALLGTDSRDENKTPHRPVGPNHPLNLSTLSDRLNATGFNDPDLDATVAVLTSLADHILHHKEQNRARKEKILKARQRLATIVDSFQAIRNDSKSCPPESSKKPRSILKPTQQVAPSQDQAVASGAAARRVSFSLQEAPKTPSQEPPVLRSLLDDMESEIGKTRAWMEGYRASIMTEVICRMRLNGLFLLVPISFDSQLIAFKDELSSDKPDPSRCFELISDILKRFPSVQSSELNASETIGDVQENSSAPVAPPSPGASTYSYTGFVRSMMAILNVSLDDLQPPSLDVGAQAQMDEDPVLDSPALLAVVSAPEQKKPNDTLKPKKSKPANLIELKNHYKHNNAARKKMIEGAIERLTPILAQMREMDDNLLSHQRQMNNILGLSLLASNNNESVGIDPGTKESEAPSAKPSLTNILKGIEEALGSIQTRLAALETQKKNWINDQQTLPEAFEKYTADFKKGLAELVGIFSGKPKPSEQDKSKALTTVKAMRKTLSQPKDLTESLLRPLDFEAHNDEDVAKGYPRFSYSLFVGYLMKSLNVTLDDLIETDRMLAAVTPSKS